MEVKRSKDEKIGQEPTMGELQNSGKGSEKAYHEREEVIEEENSEEDHRAGWYYLQTVLE